MAASATARPSLSLLRASSKAWIGGRWTAAANGATFPVYSPSTGQKIADVSDVGEEEAEAAIREAYKAQRLWAASLAKVWAVM